MSVQEIPFEERQSTVEANQLFSSIGSLDGQKGQELFASSSQLGGQMFESVQVRDSWLSESESMGGASFSSTLLKIVHNVHQQAVVYCRFVKLMVERQDRQSDMIQEYAKYVSTRSNLSGMLILQRLCIFTRSCLEWQQR